MKNAPHITFVHGIGNKPEKEQLSRIWLEALSEDRGRSLGFSPETNGVSVSFVYWADLFYSNPLPSGKYESRSQELEKEFQDNLKLDSDEWMEVMKQKLPFTDLDENGYPDADVNLSPSDFEYNYERIPIPWVLKKRFLKSFLSQVHDYLFNENEIRTKIRNRLLADLENNKSETNIIVGHSMGTIIAYDVLTMEKQKIDSFLTIGTPLGIDEVQDKLSWSRNDGFPKKLNGDWVNIYDSFDLVARLDPKLANDFKKNGNKVVKDINENNWGTWRHSATKYLKGNEFRTVLRKMCGR